MDLAFGPLRLKVLVRCVPHKGLGSDALALTTPSVVPRGTSQCDR